MWHPELESAVPEEFYWTFPARIPALRRFGAGEILSRSRLWGPADPDALNVHVDSDPLVPIPAEFADSWYNFRAHEDLICSAIVDALLTHYPLARRHIIERDGLDFIDDFAPSITGIDDLAKMVALQSVSVFAAIEGQGDIGFLFHCAWEPEHDLGVRVWGDRVVCVDDGDIAILDREHILYHIEHFGDGLTPRPG